MERGTPTCRRRRSGSHGPRPEGEPTVGAVEARRLPGVHSRLEEVQGGLDRPRLRHDRADAGSSSFFWCGRRIPGMKFSTEVAHPQSRGERLGPVSQPRQQVPRQPVPSCRHAYARADPRTARGRRPGHAPGAARCCGRALLRRGWRPRLHRRLARSDRKAVPLWLRLFTAAGQLVTTGRRRTPRLARHWPWASHITVALERLALLTNPG